MSSTRPAESAGHAIAWLMGLVGMLLVSVMGVVLYAGRNTEPTQRIAQVERCVESTDETHFSGAAVQRLLARPPFNASDRCWQAVTLPDVKLPLAVVDMDEARPLQRAWFRVPGLRAGALPPNGALTVHLPRIVGAGWQAFVDGMPLADNRDNGPMTWNEPVTLQIPAAMLTGARPPDLRIAITYHPEFGYTMSRVYAGSAGALRLRVALRGFLHETVPTASNVVLLAMGLLFFVFWFVRRQETTHLLLPLAGIAWAVCNLQYVLHRPGDDRLELWYDAVVTVSISWVMWLIYLFSLRFDALRVKALEYFLPAFVLFMTLTQLPVWPRYLEFDILFQCCNLLLGLLVTGYISWRAWKSSRIELKAISASLVIAILSGGHDVLLYAQVADPEDVYLLPFSTVLVYGAMLFALMCRYVSAINASERYGNELEQRLMEQTRELDRQYQMLRSIERKQVLVDERQRLMRDMHDGLGSALLSTLVAVDQGRMTPQEVSGVLRDCIEDLRMVIDSLEPLGQDLELLLATMRHRLGQRLKAAGLAMHWEVGDLPKLDWLESPQALQVMRMVQEILTNVVKHAQASVVRIVARHEPDGGGGGAGDAVVEIGDNGVGFDVRAVASGRGLRHLASRSAALGIGLEVLSSPGAGTRVILRLPVRRADPR